MSREFIIYADESEKHGRYFSNFYGGALIRSEDIAEVQQLLLDGKAALRLFAEVKWDKVTSQYLDRYLVLMDTLFDLVAKDKIKLRVMFTQNINVAQGLSREQIENAYFLLYYQFIKHAFGLAYSNQTGDPISCRLYFDRLPDTREKIKMFKAFLCGLPSSPEFRRARIRIKPDQITEIDSHDHVIVQCLDVVLGAIQFRLNDKHKEKPPGSRCRGKKTIAKEKLYKYITARIRSIYPNFNIGITTGIHGDPANRWKHPYRHWCFVPEEHRKDFTRAKP